MTRAWAAAALVAALLLVLLGRVIPLPPLVTGEESVRTRLVETRAKAITQRYRFQQAALDYQHYLASHEIPNLPTELRTEADELDAGGDRKTLLEMARSRVVRIAELGNAMIPYAQAGDDFFAGLQRYDDDLMSWSRTLGPRSEGLRRATWPILEWLKRYPVPIGMDKEFASVPARLVVSTTRLIETLAPTLDTPDASSETIRRLAAVADGLWDAGKNIPSVDRYHDGYFSALRRYDAESLEVAATPDDKPGGPPVLAWMGVTLLGLLILAALVLILAPPPFWSRLPALSIRWPLFTFAGRRAGS